MNDDVNSLPVVVVANAALNFAIIFGLTLFNTN